MDTFIPPDLASDVVLDRAIRPPTASYNQVADAKSIFLTGPTGFLGAFLLVDLLKQTTADIYCLVRSEDAEKARGRIRSSLQRYEVWDQALSQRIVPVVGDLSKPLLGLSYKQFGEMAGLVDVIFHNGALVNFFYPYSMLKPTNVMGTHEVARLACQTKLKPLHYISSTAIFAATVASGAERIRERDIPIRPRQTDSGYTQSKWVAERIVSLASSRGLPVAIYRPSSIAGHSRTGVSDLDNSICMFLKACIQIGAAPRTGSELNIVPVDYVSKAIVHLSKRNESIGKAFHLVNAVRISYEEVFDFIRSQGYSIPAIAHSEWRERLVKAASGSVDNTLLPLFFLFGQDRLPAQPAREAKRARKSKTIFSFGNTLEGLAGTSIVCPEVEGQLLSTYFSYFVRTGFISDVRAREYFADSRRDHIAPE